MCDGEHRALFELLVYQFLDFFLGDKVDVSGGLVQDHNSVFAKDCAADADQRFFTGGKVVATL